jgi:hypothetical protein
MISKHISYNEAIKSSTGIRLGIENKPNGYQLGNMILVADKIFEPLREWVSGPIRVNSFFRCAKLNKAIGGSPRSQHCEGRAIDLDDTFGYKTNAEMFNYIKSNLSFDNLIWEFGNDENPAWVHVSFVSEDQNRNQVLKACREKGKTIYKVY